MDLKSKLKHLDSHFHPFRAEQHKQLSKKDLTKWIPGREIENESGKCFKYTTRAECQVYGRDLELELEKVERKGYALAGKDLSLLKFDHKKALFVDTETTGLTGGTGTVPFLVGIGFFSDKGFTVEQFMMRDYDEEPALLRVLAPRFQEAEFIVSYNGKSYDINILSTRLILNRIDNYLRDLGHLDLLYTTRRIWGARLQDCSLLNIERSVLDVFRQDDIPGFMIPRIYFDYIKYGKGDHMARVFKHNRFDIMTLAVLTLKTATIYLEPERFLEHPRDFASIARSLESMGEYKKASRCYERALQNKQPHSEHEQTLYRLGYLFKGRHNWTKANRIWECIIKKYPSSFDAYEELAKYYEHQCRQFGKAREVVNKALERMEVGQELRGGLECRKIRERFEYRLERLHRKVLQGGGK